MIPWSIALLTLFYGIIATASAAMAWKGLAGLGHPSLLWAGTWLALSGGAVCGLPLLRPWGRRCAVWTSWLLILSTLATAGVIVASGRPGMGLLVTLSTACHYVMIRYLQRPAVRTWFDRHTAIYTP